MRVELDVFSGRPNPAWELKDEERRELLRLLSLLVEAGGEAPQGGLGYRGLCVTVSGDEVNGCDQAVIFGGFVQCSGSAGERTFLDHNRHLERWLLTTGKEHLDSNLFDAMRQEIDR